MRLDTVGGEPWVLDRMSSRDGLALPVPGTAVSPINPCFARSQDFRSNRVNKAVRKNYGDLVCSYRPLQSILFGMGSGTPTAPFVWHITPPEKWVDCAARALLQTESAAAIRIGPHEDRGGRSLVPGEAFDHVSELMSWTRATRRP